MRKFLGRQETVPDGLGTNGAGTVGRRKEGVAERRSATPKVRSFTAKPVLCVLPDKAACVLLPCGSTPASTLTGRHWTTSFCSGPATPDPAAVKPAGAVPGLARPAARLRQAQRPAFEPGILRPGGLRLPSRTTVIGSKLRSVRTRGGQSLSLRAYGPPHPPDKNKGSISPEEGQRKSRWTGSLYFAPHPCKMAPSRLIVARGQSAYNGWPMGADER